MATGGTAGGYATWRDDARIVAWWVAVAAAVGGIVGLVVGGIGGRLLMLILRSTSDGVDGVVSDDGFEMGRVTAETVDLLAFGATAGALFAGFYVLVRQPLPPRARIPGAALLAGLVGGAAFINPDGVDLGVLEPTWLAVAGFTVLPGVAGLLVAVLVERAARVAPWTASRWWLLALVPALATVQGAVVLTLAGLVAVGVRRLVTPAAGASHVRRFVPGILVVLVALAAAGLVTDVMALV